MIANWSRLSAFAKCREKAWNWSEERLEPWQAQLPLLTGGGFHHGVADYFASHSIQSATAACEADIRKNLEGKIVLSEEQPSIAHAIAWSKLAVAKFAEHYEGQPVQVLWPEVQFMVSIPDSLHCCWEFHKRFCGDVPFAKHNEEFIYRQFDTDSHPVCFQPHWFRGKTDAVVSYLGDVWLMEHKTNSQATENLVNRFFLDAQVTGYLYGIWKQMGMLPAGFILNVIQKPNARAKDQMTVGFAREIFERCTEDLVSFEGEFREQATQYENAFRNKHLGNPFATFRTTTACMDYGRKCHFFDKCQRHPREALADEFMTREPDYVELAYQEVYEKWRLAQQSA